MNTKIKVLISLSGGLVILLFCVFGFLMYKQQQQIKNLSAMVEPKSADFDPVQIEKNKEAIEEVKKTIEIVNKEQQEKQMIENLKNVTGELKSISEDKFVMEVWLTDFKALLDGNSKSGGAKEYIVTKNADTEIDKEIKVGDLVSAYAEKSVFNVSSFTATKIEKASLGKKAE